jgi:hypothetical protein
MKEDTPKKHWKKQEKQQIKLFVNQCGCGEKINKLKFKYVT